MQREFKYQIIQLVLGFLFHRVLVEQDEPQAQLPSGRGVTYVVEGMTIVEKIYLYWLLTSRELPRPDLGWLHKPAPDQPAPELLDVSEPIEARNRLSVAIQSDSEQLLVPLNVIWDKRPDKQSAKPLAALLGTFDQPSIWRKAWEFVNISWQSFFVFGTPVARFSSPLTLRDVRQEYPQADSGELTELSHELLKETLREQRQSIVGPEIKRNIDITEAILRDPNTTDLIHSLAREQQKDTQDLQQRARDLLEELSSDFSLIWLKGLGAMLSPIFYRIYKGFYVDKRGMNRLMAMSGRRVVLVPSHKSHIDYLVLSYVLYQHGMMPPHIAAGINLAFWPVGTIFRKSGAFFIRRSFADDKLYAHIFHQYLTQLLQNDIMVEFFIEGTRSRTGKVMKPRYGMLKSILKICIEQQMDDIVFQPMSVGYEKVIEGSSYQRESQGGEKESESTAGLLKASTVLVSDYGRVHIEFGEPVEARAYLERYGVNSVEVDPEALEDTAIRLAHRVAYEIANATPVTPSALVGLVLMNHLGAVRERAFYRELGFLMQVMLHPHNKARISSPIQAALGLQGEDSKPDQHEGPILLRKDSTPIQDQAWLTGRLLEQVVRQAVLLLEKNGLIQAREQGGELEYEARPRKRGQLNYYKNNIIHFLVDEMILASSLLAARRQGDSSLEAASRHSHFLSKVMKWEFIYNERSETETRLTRFEAAFHGAADFFEDVGWVQRQGDQIHLLPEGLDAVAYLHDCLWPYIESYQLAATLLPQILPEQKWLNKKDVTKQLLKRGQNQLSVGLVRHPEAIDKTTFENAMRILIEMKALEQRHVTDKKGRRTTEYSASEDPRIWQEIQQKLADIAQEAHAAPAQA